MNFWARAGRHLRQVERTVGGKSLKVTIRRAVIVFMALQVTLFGMEMITHVLTQSRVLVDLIAKFAPTCER